MKRLSRNDKILTLYWNISPVAKPVQVWLKKTPNRQSAALFERFEQFLQRMKWIKACMNKPSILTEINLTELRYELEPNFSGLPLKNQQQTIPSELVFLEVFSRKGLSI